MQMSCPAFHTFHTFPDATNTAHHNATAADNSGPHCYLLPSLQAGGNGDGNGCVPLRCVACRMRYSHDTL